jgi:NADH-quinone oxidoreductase subunit H
MDPLFADGVDLAVVLIVVLKVIVTFVFLLVGVLMMIWFERKIISDMQNRIGPNRAGPWGLLQSLADGIKIFFKEDLLPEEADAPVFRLAPYLSTVTAFAAFAVIPIGGSISIAGHETFLQLADPPVGVLFLLAMSSIAVYGVMLAGWSSGSKYPLLGSVRASAQMVSYEAALGLATVSVVLLSGSLSTHSIVAEQAGEGYSLIGVDVVPGWNLVATGIVPFVIFLLAGTAELNRPPFDLVEAEQELVGGFHTEYSSIRFAFFYLAEFMNTVTMSAILVTLFLGGPAGPTFAGPAWIWGIVWFMAKLSVFLFMFVWFRATLPRFRYDQLMNLGWKVLIPLALAWLLLLAAINIGRDHDWNVFVVVGACFGVLVVGWGALNAAVRVGQERRAEEEEAYA